MGHVAAGVWMVLGKLHCNILFCSSIGLLKGEWVVGDIILVYRGISGVLAKTEGSKN